jgi:heat shock protein HslJ
MWAIVLRFEARYIRAVRPAVAPLVLAIVAVLVAGCGDDDAGGTDVAALDGVPWALTAGIDVDGWEAFAPSVSFEGGMVSGSTGCNRYSGGYTLDGGSLELGAVAATRMACPPPADAVERELLAALERVAAWSIEDDELVLLDADDADLLRFEPATPGGSWVATGLLRGDAFTSPIAGTEITASFGQEDDLSGSAGCNSYTATYTTDRGAIEISEPASTKKLCSEPGGVMEQEAAYLQALPDAARYRVDGSSLELLSQDGAAVARYARAP